MTDQAQTYFEVHDAAGHNVGECREGSVYQTAERAIATTAAMPELGRVYVVRVVERVVVERQVHVVCEIMAGRVRKRLRPASVAA